MQISCSSLVVEMLSLDFLLFAYMDSGHGLFFVVACALCYLLPIWCSVFLFTRRKEKKKEVQLYNLSLFPTSFYLFFLLLLFFLYVIIFFLIFFFGSNHWFWWIGAITAVMCTVIRYILGLPGSRGADVLN